MAPARKPPAWRLPVLIVVLLALLGAVGVLVVSKVFGHHVVSFPIAEPDAVLEPPPAPGVEGEVLAEARGYLDNYELDAAEVVLRRLLLDNPKSALAHAYRARLAYRRGQMRDGSCDPAAVAAAERELALADALQPDLAESKIARGFLAYFARDYARARSFGLDAEKTPASALRASLLLAVVAANAGALAEAEERANAIVSRVREGYLVDSAYDVLAQVYGARHEYRRLAALRRVIAQRRARAARGAQRGDEKERP